MRHNISYSISQPLRVSDQEYASYLKINFPAVSDNDKIEFSQVLLCLLLHLVILFLATIVFLKEKRQICPRAGKTIVGQRLIIFFN